MSSVRSDVDVGRGRARYTYKHVVGLQETNLIGNVYFVNFASWQGRCREMFLREKAPDVLDALQSGLRIVTRTMSLEFFEEARAFDELEIAMYLGYQQQHKIGLEFEYHVVRDGRHVILAHGSQEVACMRQEKSGDVPTRPPESLLRALTAYGPVQGNVSE